jgi:hypothetical protein
MVKKDGKLGLVFKLSASAMKLSCTQRKACISHNLLLMRSCDMYLICSDPNNYENDYTKNICYAPTKNHAEEIARKMSAQYDRAYIFKLDKYLVPIAPIQTQAYSMNDKGEILPCA